MENAPDFIGDGKIPSNNEILEKWLNIDEVDTHINSEIARNEYQRLKSEGGFKNRKLKSKITGKLSDSQVFSTLLGMFTASTIFMMNVLTTPNAVIYMNNVENSFIKVLIVAVVLSLVFIVPISLCLFVFLFNNIPFLRKTNAVKNIFDKMNIPLNKFSKENKAKILSIFSIFLNNSWKPFLYSHQEKLEILRRVSSFCNSGDGAGILRQFASIIEDYEESEKSIKLYGFCNSSEAKNKVLLAGVLNSHQYKMLGLVNENQETINNTQDDIGFSNVVFNKNIPQNKIDAFVANLVADLKSTYSAKRFKQNLLNFDYGEKHLAMAAATAPLVFLKFLWEALGFNDTVVTVLTIGLLSVILSLIFYSMFKSIKDVDKVLSPFLKSEKNDKKEEYTNFMTLASLIMMSSSLKGSEKNEEELKSLSSDFFNPMFNKEVEIIKLLKKSQVQEVNRELLVAQNSSIKDFRVNPDEFKNVLNDFKKDVLFDK